MTQPITRRKFLHLLGLSSAGVVLAQCAPAGQLAVPLPSATSAGVAPVRGSRPTIRMLGSPPQGLPEYPHPFGFQTGPGFVRMTLLFDTLAWRDSTLDPLPWLAEEWAVSDDGLEWTFTLRPGVNFHDGEPLAVDDVVFSYRYVADNATNWYSPLPQLLKDVEATGQSTLRLILNAPFAPFLNGIASRVPIIPRHIWENVDDPRRFTDDAAYIGSGPYQLDIFNPTEASFLYVVNDDYFLGPPYVQRLEFVPAGDELVALRAGDLDVASPSPASGVPNEALAPFRDDPRFAILDAPGEGTTALHFNLARGEPYDDVTFRRAVITAIDREELVTRVLDGNGEPGTPGYLAPSNPYSNPDVQRYPYDPDRARALLDEAGYRLEDGQRQMPDGSPLVMPLLFAAPFGRTAELVRNHLAAVGIGVELRSVDPGTANQLQGEGNFDTALVTYGGLGSDPDFMRRAFSSPGQAMFWWKAWGYDNSELNGLAQEQLRALDFLSRKEIVDRMQAIIAQDVPVMPLFYPTRFLIYDPEVFDAWYYTPLWTPLPQNKHVFVTGQKVGLESRGT
jgi:peptide/nickel transport system substrate-binding protein